MAAGFARVRDTHGGQAIFYYGGGGQGNHLGGGYASATRAALGSRYASNALAQEKTGEFWVDGQLFGSSTCHTAGDYEQAQVAVFWGKNPWQSHGFPRARVVLKEIAKDPDRTLVVVDPRRSETAELADIHLAPVPGGDAFLLAALVADAASRTGWSMPTSWPNGPWASRPSRPPSPAWTSTTTANEPVFRPRTCGDLARLIGQAASVSIFEDLGIQMAPHSTLNSYLEKLVVLLTGNFAKRGRHEPAHRVRPALRPPRRPHAPR